MADYHLLQDKEHYDEEDVALPSIYAENAKVMLSEYIILSLGLCVIALVSGDAIFRLFNLFVFNDPASAEDIFFLGAFSSQRKSSSMKIVADQQGLHSI